MDNIKQLEDWSNIREVINKRIGIKEIEKFKPCLSRSHNPPSHIVLSPGKYEYTCPDCGGKTIFTVPLLTS